eukprot:6418192-Pyramimonas_sp.AAC.1
MWASRPFARLVAPYGAPPKVPVGGFTCAPPSPNRHAPHMLRGPIGDPIENDPHNCGTHNCIWVGPSSG